MSHNKLAYRVNGCLLVRSPVLSLSNPEFLQTVSTLHSCIGVCMRVFECNVNCANVWINKAIYPSAAFLLRAQFFRHTDDFLNPVDVWTPNISGIFTAPYRIYAVSLWFVKVEPRVLRRSSHLGILHVCAFPFMVYQSQLNGKKHYLDLDMLRDLSPITGPSATTWLVANAVLIRIGQLMD